MKKTLNSQSGFTLIELLVGVILFVISAIVVTTLVINSGDSTKRSASVAAQNSELRSAMEQIRRDFADAEMLVVVDNKNTSGSGGAYGESVSFVREVEKGDGTSDYVAERIAYHGASDPDTELRHTITVQTSQRYATLNVAKAVVLNPDGTPRDESTVWTEANAPAKVLADQMLSTAQKPVFRYFETATQQLPHNADAATLQTTTALIDVALRHDEDLPAAGAEGDSKNPTASVVSSVFLSRAANTTPTSGGDSIGC